MRILALDTATEICGVAIMIDGEIVVASMTSRGLTHAQGLIGNIRSALAEAGMAMNDLTALVVTRGPGSFTGLRIGISTAKGLAAATGKPLVGISSLALLAHQAPDTAVRVCPMIDARRSEVYWSLYERGSDGLQRVRPEQAGSPEQVWDAIDGACLFIGNGAGRYADRIEQDASHPVTFADERLNDPQPGILARLGMQRLLQGRFEDPRRFAPVYLRKSDARKSGNDGMKRSGSSQTE